LSFFDCEKIFLFSIDFRKTFMYIMSILKANHNKDYSVVKTFRAALPSGRRSLFGAGRCGTSLLEGVASNEVRARGRLSPQKNSKIARTY